MGGTGGIGGDGDGEYAPNHRRKFLREECRVQPVEQDGILLYKTFALHKEDNRISLELKKERSHSSKAAHGEELPAGTQNPGRLYRYDSLRPEFYVYLTQSPL